ncbi:amidohydrolase family protein [Pseudomonas wadenswilerensis]
MNHNNTLIDSHVHFFTQEDLKALGDDLPYELPAANPLKDYLDALSGKGLSPVLLNNVHLSILPDSENVFASFKQLEALQRANPGQYEHIALVGTIKADPLYANAQRLGHPQVIGVRIVLHDAPPASVATDTYATPAWQALYQRLAAHQHVHVYAQDAATNLRVLQQIPASVRVVIDHLGTCHASRGADDGAFLQLLEAARQRGNVWFKGPGYRTSTVVAEVAPFAQRIVETLGADRLLLQASDAPHVGADPTGNAYAGHFDPVSAFDFVRQLAETVARRTNVSAETLLNGAVATLFPQQTSHQATGETMSSLSLREIKFDVDFGDQTLSLDGTVFEPASPDLNLPPVVFNSGFTGGVSMYGQLFGRALAARGYRVMTYDVAGFFNNKAVRNTAQVDGKTVTNVSLEDQKAEVLGAVAWVREAFGQMPVVASWAMGSVASLAAIAELARGKGEQVKLWVPMSYTGIRSLQALRADAKAADAAIAALDPNAAIPPFDTGTEATRLGYYPLDPATQQYVDEQLGAYTDAGGADRWPGCAWVSARSYTSYVAFDPEQDIEGASGFPPALIIHGALNSLHMPAESERLYRLYPGDAGDGVLVISDMQHGQQNVAGHPVFEAIVQNIDEAVRQQL